MTSLPSRKPARRNKPGPTKTCLSLLLRDERSLLTLNRKHFVRLHAQRTDHAGIIVCTFDPDFARQAQRIDVEIGAKSDLRGQLIHVNRPAAP